MPRNLNNRERDINTQQNKILLGTNPLGVGKLGNKAVRATVKVHGNVQAVGYRALVRAVARRLGVKGLVRNLEDGSVEIFAEAEARALERFLKLIEIKGRPDDLLSLHVDRVEVYREGEPGYRGPWRSYGIFEIDYGEEKPRPIEKDMAESLEWAKLYFTKLVSEFGGFRREFKDFREEFREFRGEFKEFRGGFRGFKEESLKLSREILKEVKELRSDLKTLLDERLARMEKDIAEIKAKLGLL